MAQKTKNTKTQHNPDRRQFELVDVDGILSADILAAKERVAEQIGKATGKRPAHVTNSLLLRALLDKYLGKNLLPQYL